MMSKLKLTVNETKTRLGRVPGETFNFLGYTIGRCYSRQTGRGVHRYATVCQGGATHLRGRQRGHASGL